jgi:hypothetical protein
MGSTACVLGVVESSVFEAKVVSLLIYLDAVLNVPLSFK